MTHYRGIKPTPSEKDSSNFSSSGGDSSTSEKQLSIRQICEFPVRFCRRNSKDLKTRLYGFWEANESALEAIKIKFLKQIQNAVSYLVFGIALLILALEMFWCLSLLSNIPFEPGFCFLLIVLIIICVVINGRIMTHSSQPENSTSKDKSKEI